VVKKEVGGENRGVCGEKVQNSGKNIKNGGENKLHHVNVIAPTVSLSGTHIIMMS
jgi:hypothetical protein